MVNCCVVGCNNSRKNSSAAMHKFPKKGKEPQRYKAWKNRINRANFYPNENHVVCSLHFKEDDFENDLMRTLLPEEKIVRRLKKTAVPSLMLCNKQMKNSSAFSIRKSSYIRKKVVAQFQCDLGDQPSTSKQPDTSMSSIDTDVEFFAEPQQNMTIDIGIQCELGFEVFYKYSTLFESDNNESDESVHSSEFSTKSSDYDSFVLENSETASSSANDQVDEQFQQLPGNFEFVLVQVTALLSLFKFCGVCNSPITDIIQYSRGVVLYINYKCSQGHDRKWCSHTNPEKYAIHLAGAISLSGINFIPFLNFAKTLKLLFISSSTYYKIIRTRVAPVIYNFWLNYRNSLFEKAKLEKELWISGDGQYDSPGYSAKYVTYSIMDVKTKLILDFTLLQRGMIEGDLEKAACDKALADITKKLNIKLFLSDRHRGVGVLMRTKYPHIHHEFDVWHLSKSLLKKLGKAEKKSKLLSEWTRAITNHLWWSSETCEGNGQVLLGKFTSLLKHVCNIHEWMDENGVKQSCEHRPFLDEEIREIKWISFGSTDYQVLQTEIMNKAFLNDLKHTSHYCHTSSLESYHNVRLKYVPKRVHFSYNGMYIRSILAILDHNNNVGREVVGGDVQFSKATKQWRFKNKYKNKNNAWKNELLDKIINYDPVRDNLPQVNFKVPKNIYKVPKPSLSEAKKKTCIQICNKEKIKTVLVRQLFFLSGKTKYEKPIPIFLRSRDIIIVMTKDSRLAYHGVPKILQMDSRYWNIIHDSDIGHVPKDYKEIVNICNNDELWKPFGFYLNHSRININVRQVLNRGQKRLHFYESDN